jgi:hypothetical protein
MNNHDISNQKMAFDISPEMGEDPPPTYYNSSHELGAEQYEVATSSLPLSQATQTLVEALNSILDASFEKGQLAESLETALRQQPVAKHEQIFDIAQTIFHACRNVYEPKEDSSTINHKGKHQLIAEKDLGASQSESKTEHIAAECYTQLRQGISAENQPELQESAQTLKLAQANSSEKVVRSEATSSNTKTLPISRSRNIERTSTPFATSLMTCDASSRKSSRVSSPEDMDTPLQKEDALQKETQEEPKETQDEPKETQDEPKETQDEPKETQEEPKEPAYEFRSLINQSAEDFIFHVHQQIIEFTWYKNTLPALSALVSSLLGEESQAELLCSELEWSSGSQWLSLAEEGQKDKKKGAVLYAFAAMEFQKWHQAQLQQHKDLPLQSASKLIADGLIGPRPTGSYQQKKWTQRRSNISTLLTRGNKWAQLVEHLGLGILFKW